MPAPAPAPPPDPPLASSLWPAAAALLAYLAWAPPVSGDKDASELTLVLATGGAAHPTGYPVWVAAGHGFVSALTALGVAAPHAANAWSAVGGAVAVFALHALATRLVPRDAPLMPGWRLALAWIPATLFGLDPMWTYETTLAEVYSWHVAWGLLAALAFTRLWRGADAADARHVVGWALLCGLGLAHHVTSLAVSAPLTLALVGRRALAPRHLGLAAAAGLAPLATYGLVAWQAWHPAAWTWPALQPTWASVFAHVTGAAYRGYLGGFAPSPEQRVMLAAYVWPVLAVALLGHAAAVALARGRERGLLGALFAAVGLGTAWAFSYGVPDPGSYFMAPLALAMAATVALGASLEARWPAVARGGAVVAALACLAVGPRWATVAADRRDAFVTLDGVIREMWASIPFDEAIVLWPGDTYTLWVERQVLHGEKPGIEILNPWLLPQEAPAARFRARHGFDPLVGAPRDDPRWRLTLGDREAAAALADDLARAISANTPLPVIVADPNTLSVRLVRKP